MGKPQRRKRTGVRNKKWNRLMKNKALERGIDQVYEDLQPENMEKVKAREADITLPGLGQFHCVACVRHFINLHALTEHCKTKDHKRRKKTLKEKPFDHKEAAFLHR